MFVFGGPIEKRSFFGISPKLGWGPLSLDSIQVEKTQLIKAGNFFVHLYHGFVLVWKVLAGMTGLWDMNDY